VRPPDSERLRADTRKTPLQGGAGPIQGAAFRAETASGGGSNPLTSRESVGQRLRKCHWPGFPSIGRAFLSGSDIDQRSSFRYGLDPTSEFADGGSGWNQGVKFWMDSRLFAGWGPWPPCHGPSLTAPVLLGGSGGAIRSSGWSDSLQAAIR
jgi:hypothetical protein